MTTAASGSLPFQDIVRSASTAKALITSRRDALWPSEVASLSKQVGDILGAAASAAASKAVADMERITEPLAGLTAASKALGRETNDFLIHVPESDKDGLIDRIVALQKRFADDATAPLLQKASNAPVSIEGVRQISAIIANDIASVNNLDGALKKPIVEKLERECSSRLAGLMEARLAELKSHPPGLEGLTRGAAWWKSFEADFSPFSTYAEVSGARSQFLVDRALRLKQAVAEFEVKVQGRSTEAEGLAGEYLSLPDDRKHPISLDYAFVVEAARKASGR
jgi:hypothetical protein